MTQGKLPVFVNQWTIGNILSIVVICGGLIGVYNNLQSSIAVQAVTIQQQQEAIASVRADALDREARLRALELGFSRVDEKMSNIVTQLNRIEQTLKSK